MFVKLKVYKVQKVESKIASRLVIASKAWQSTSFLLVTRLNLMNFLTLQTL